MVTTKIKSILLTALDTHFIQTVKTVVITRATDFDGRSSRSEYWFYTLYSWMINVGLMSLDHMMGIFAIGGPIGILSIGPLTTIWSIATLYQCLALTARRLHDRGHSGWWQLLFAIPFIQIIPLYWVIRQAKDTPEALNYKNPYGKPYQQQ